MAATSLQEAADEAAQNLQPLWIADTLRDRMIAFWQAIAPEFPEEIPNNRPVGNWIAIIAAFSPSILDYAEFQEGSITTFETAVDYIYRLCKFLTYYPFATSEQYDAVLAAYNAQFT